MDNNYITGSLRKKELLLWLLIVCISIILGILIGISFFTGLILTILIMGVLFSLWIEPFWLLVILILSSSLYVYRVKTPWDFNISIFRMFFIFLVISLSIRILGIALKGSQIDNYILRFKLVLLLMFLIGIAYAIGLIRSYPQQKSLAPIFFLNHLIGLILVVSMTFLISTKRRIVILSYAYLASGIIPLLLGGYQLMYWFFHHDVPILPFSNFIYLPKLAQIYARVSADISLPRVIGSFTDPNFFGYFLTSIILISLSLFFYYKQKKRKFAIKIVLLLYIFVSFFGLLFTFSRSSLFGLGIGGLVLTRLHRNITTSLFMKYAFFGCFFIILFLSLVNVGLFDKGIIKYSDFLHARLSTGLFDRIERARNGVRAFLNQPILGIGLANFEFEYGYRRDASTTHIFYLTILSELGLMGFFPVTTFLILISIQSIRKISNPQIPDHLSALGSGLLSSLLALMAANLYYDNLFGIESFWVLIGLVTVYGYVRLPRRD